MTKEPKMTNKYAEEAPYHPGYEDAVMTQVSNPIIDELNQYRRMNEKYSTFARTIVDYIINQKRK